METYLTCLVCYSQDRYKINIVNVKLQDTSSSGPPLGLQANKSKPSSAQRHHWLNIYTNGQNNILTLEFRPYDAMQKRVNHPIIKSYFIL